MKNILKALLPILIALSAASCGSHHETARTAVVSSTPVKDQTWQLTLLNGRNVPQNSKAATLSFNPEAGSFRGQTACNFYAGAYTLGSASPDDARLPVFIELLGSGSIRCPEADMNAETRYLSALQKADFLFLNGHTLSLYRGDKEILRFELQ